MRGIHEWAITPLQGTEQALYPCFSPDGASIAFVKLRQGLQRISLSGGPPVPVLTVQDGEDGGISWNADGRIAFSRVAENAGIWRVPAKEGPPEVLATPNGRGGSIRYMWPQVLPGGDAVLFTILERGHAGIAAFSFRTRTLKTLVQSGTHARYLAATGHLVYQWDGRLLGVPFDLPRLEVAGEPIPVAEDAVGNSSPFAQEYDVSLTGTLAYLPPQVTRLSWTNRNGVVTPIPATVPGTVGHVALSPAGQGGTHGVRGAAGNDVTNLQGDVP